MDSLTIISKLAIIMHWFKLITFHTKGLIKVYKKKGWLLPIDQLVDDYSIINQISKYEMLKYKIVFESDDNNTVKQKAICNHSYGVWIKTTDIVVITYDIARIIYGYSDESVKKLSTSRAALLELYDNMLKIRDVYTGIIFAHRAFYVDKRQDHNSQVLEAQERDAQRIIESIDDMLQITGGFLSDNIDDLLLAKQEYKNRLSIFMSEDQERKLDDYMVKVANKIKENVSKLSIYDRLYEATTDEFKKYAQNLLKFQNIFSSLVSAEYLYHQYVENKEPINKFDYSCISIMYYMALEDFVNKLIYTSYAEEILDPNDDLVKNDYKRYVSHRFKFYDKDNSCFKKSCEIGNLGHLLYNLSRETAFTDYLRNRYVGIDLKKMIEYGNKLINVAQRRNDAAHGGNLLSYDDVRYDKKKVYSNATDEYRGLILELFKLLFGA